MDFNNNKKSFEELLREKVEHHEMPFEANSWSQMQNKLQAHQAQAAATQTTLYKSILLKTGKVLVGVISGSAIVYSALSLSGMLDKKETAANKNQAQQEIALTQDVNKQSPSNTANAGNTAMLNLPVDNANASENASAENTTEKEITAKQNNTAQNFSATNKKHFLGKANMQQEKGALNKNALAVQNSGLVKDNVSAEKVTGNNAVKESTTGTFGKNQQINSDVNAAKNQKENPYIASEKNASANQNIVANKEGLVKENIAQENAIEKPVAESNDNVIAADAEVDSATALNNNGAKYPEKPSVNKPKSKIGVIVSGGLNRTLLSNREVSSTTLDIVGTPMFGLHAAMPINEKVAVQAGAQYVSHDVRNVSHTSAVVKYAILQDSSVTRTSITQCKYVEFPLIVKYAVIPRVNVYTGLRTSLLIGANATVSQEQYINKRLASSTPIEDGGKFAQYNGLRSVDFGLPLGVEVAISKRFSGSLNYNMGLSDFTFDKVFDNKQKDKHSSWQLQLNVRLF